MSGVIESRGMYEIEFEFHPLYVKLKFPVKVKLDEIKEFIHRKYPENRLYLDDKEIGVEVIGGIWRRAVIKFVSDDWFEIHVYRPWSTFDKKVLNSIVESVVSKYLRKYWLEKGNSEKEVEEKFKKIFRLYRQT